jgi:hypothetical protein
MNRNMELKFQVECLQDVAVVNCSGRMVRGAALDEFRRRIEQLGRVRVLVLDLSEIDHLDATGAPLGDPEVSEVEAGEPASFLPQDSRGNTSHFGV